MDSILTNIKKLIGLEEDYEVFDMDLIIHINSVFVILNQLGVGPAEPFSILDKSATWSDFWGDKQPVGAVTTYMYLKVKMLFDPPTSGITNTAMENSIKELEWRLNVQTDKGE